MNGIPVERVEALLRLLGHDEMTPTARRMFQLVCDEYRGYERRGVLAALANDAQEWGLYDQQIPTERLSGKEDSS